MHRSVEQVVVGSGACRVGGDPLFSSLDASRRRRALQDGGPITVASVPAGHVYVRHALTGPDASRVRVLPDPPGLGGSEQSQWWPPAVLAPSWPASVRDEVDVVHLQFGFDARSPQQLTEWVQALREAAIPLVYTVHDLRNPHHLDRALHDAQLDVLVPAADALITLTEGAAGEIARRWGRHATVLPHPHVVPLETMTRHRPRRTGVIGVHAKSLRACLDPVAVLDTLTEVAAGLPGASVRLDAHRDVAEPDGARYDPVLAAALARDDVDAHVHDFFTDDELWAYLGGLDVSVLPYRFGTHSGWLEACLDLGTAVVAPTCGHYADQGPVQSFAMDVHGLDTDSLARAVETAWRTWPAPRRLPSQRRDQRAALAAAHLRVYTEVLAG